MATYRDVVLSMSPGEYWRMNTSTPQVGLVGGVSLSSSGVFSYGVVGAVPNDAAVVFTNGYMTAGSAPAAIDTADEFTFAWWMRPVAATGTFRNLFDNRWTDPATGMQIRLNNADNTLQVIIANTTQVCASSIVVPNDSSFHFIVVRKSPGAGVAPTIYIDNVDRTGATTNGAFVATGLAWIVGDISAGAGGGPTGTRMAVGVHMDEIAIWKRVLSTTEMTDLFSSISNVDDGGRRRSRSRR